MKIKFALALFLTTSITFGAGYKPIVLDPSYEHDKWKTLPRDHVFEFAAYTTSFDGADDNNGDSSDSDKWGIPEWVSFEIKKLVVDHPLANRPSKWLTNKDLNDEGTAPTDSTYAVSGTNKLKEVKGSYRYVRGHMCPKDTAERISADAAYNTHTVLNAVPQLQWQNNGIWKGLEQDCQKWADDHDRVWVISGPVFFGKSPASLDVTAVYTTAPLDKEGRVAGVSSIHIDRVKERRRSTKRPDLVPVPDPETGSFCRRKGSKLLVRIDNQGSGPAGSFKTTVDFFSHGKVTRSTTGLGPGDSVNLEFDIPPGSFDPDVEFRIQVDASNDVEESNETNNVANDVCIG